MRSSRCRLCDRGVFETVLFRLVVGCSQSTSARLGKGCATTLRTRYNEWNRDGVFDRAVEEAGPDRLTYVPLKLSRVTRGCRSRC